MSETRYVRVAALKSADLFRKHLTSSSIDLAFDDVLLPPGESPFAKPFVDGPIKVGNRFCVLPMEGWDGTPSGEPSDLTRRRWQRFGASGAKLIWGGEAVAVRHDGRANPNQLLISEETEPALASLRDELVNAHRSNAALPPLRRDGGLDAIATGWSGEMAETTAMVHSSTFGQQTQALGYRRWGENIAASASASADEIVGRWMSSPGHRANILNAGFTAIGVGCIQGSDGRWYWTQNFGG